MDEVSESGDEGLFDGLFGRGAVGSATGTGCRRCSTPRRRLLVRWSEPGWRDAGAGAAVTAAARADRFDMAEIGQQRR